MDHVAYKSKDYFYGVHDYDHWLFAMIHIPHIQYSKALAPQKQILQDWPVDLSSVSLAFASRHILAIRPCFWTRDMRSRLWEFSQRELMGKVAHFWGVDLFWLWIGTWFLLNGSIRKRNSKLMRKPLKRHDHRSFLSFATVGISSISRRWTALWRAKLVAVTPQPSWASVRTAEFDALPVFWRFF